MFAKNKLSLAITVALTTPVSVTAQQIEEVVVTATKRAASTQDIPVTVQAMGEESLDQRNVGDFSDYLKYLPNVNFGGRGPGQNNIYIRGISTDQVAVMVSGAAGSEPNVALYLDEAPVSAAGRNLDIYVADMQRVEVLPGPQGTLFGASSQAGTLRLITNKPEINETQISVDASASTTSEGDPSNSLEFVANLPVIEDRLAIRAVGYRANSGGYIDNVVGTTSLDQTTNPLFNNGNAPGEAGGQFEDTVFSSADNADLVEEDFNDSLYVGGRLGAKLIINDDWDATVQVSKQTLEVDGVFDYDPEVGDLQVQRFYEDSLEDEFTQTAWTLEGRLNALDLIYTGSYLDREATSSIDYSGYANVGSFIPYYICEYPSYASCEAPVLGFDGESEYTREAHEVRISTDPQNSVHLVAGIYYDDVETVVRGDYNYIGSIAVGFPGTTPLESADNSNPDQRAPGVVFINDVSRVQEQLSFFGELTYRFTDTFSTTLGVRRYDIDSEIFGSSTFGARGAPNFGGRDLGEIHDPANESDTIFKLTANWTPDDDVLLYATYSEGFRPGGFNRATNEVVPPTFESDTLENYEFGWKTTLLDNTLQFNGSVYYVEWSDIQVSYFNPLPIADGGLGTNLTSTFNSGEAEILGLETDVIYWPTDNLSITGAVSLNDSELVEKPERSGDFIVDEGSSMAMSPKTQASLTARYTMTIAEMPAYWQLSSSYSSSSYSSLIVDERFQMDSYATFDGAIGVDFDNYNIELYGENLTDERAELFISNMDDIPRTVTNRPRTIGLRVSWDY